MVAGVSSIFVNIPRARHTPKHIVFMMNVHVNRGISMKTHKLSTALSVSNLLSRFIEAGI